MTFITGMAGMECLLMLALVVNHGSFPLYLGHIRHLYLEETSFGGLISCPGSGMIYPGSQLDRQALKGK